MSGGAHFSLRKFRWTVHSRRRGEAIYGSRENTYRERRSIIKVFWEEEEHISSRLVSKEDLKVFYRICFDLLPYNAPQLFTAVAVITCPFCQKCPLTKKLGWKGEVQELCDVRVLTICWTFSFCFSISTICRLRKRFTHQTNKPSYA